MAIIMVTDVTDAMDVMDVMDVTDAMDMVTEATELMDLMAHTVIIAIATMVIRMTHLSNDRVVQKHSMNQ